MKTSFAAAAILGVLALPAPSAPAQATSFECIATSVVPGTRQVTIYVSHLMPGDMSQRATLTGAWGAFIKAAYRLDTVASSVCQPLGTDPATQQRVLAAEQNGWQKGGMNVVQVNWSPGQSGNSAPRANTNPYATAQPPAGPAPKDAPPADAQAAPPPADPGPQPRTSYCYSDDKKPTVYFSDAFDTADSPSSTAWSTAFAKFLTQKYAYKGTVTCKNGDTIFNVQSTIRDQKDALQGKQTVDTDWTYEPPAPGDPAPANAAAPANSTPPKRATTHKPQ
ncbi:MAG: hypothetical protein P4L00_01360 [Candidatus Acidoferrales bacterium]|nr:hypothetical protein [Candidatus Acidoferrales bacterium]